MSILNYIEKIKRENEGPRITAQVNPVPPWDRPSYIDPADDVIEEEPTIRVAAQGGRIGLKPGGLVEPGVEYYGQTKVTVDGKKFDSIKDAAEHYGMDRRLISLRTNRGWDIKTALTTPAASPHGHEYYKDKDFLKWAKKNYPKWKPGGTLPGRGSYRIFEEYERTLARKNKIFGLEELMKALGSDNPYSIHTLRASLGSADSKITKNMAPSQQTMIKKGKIIKDIIERVGGKPKSTTEVFAPFKYLKYDIKSLKKRALEKPGGHKRKIYELNSKQIKKINTLLNQEYNKMGLQTNTIDNIYNLFDDNKFMKEIKNYDGKAVDLNSHMFKKVFKPGEGTGMAYAYMQLGRALRGEIELDGIKVDKKLGNKIIQSMAYDAAKNRYGSMSLASTHWAKFQMAKHFNDPKASYNSLTQTVRKAFNDAGIKKIDIDEIFPAKTGQLTYAKGSGVYNQFVQFIDSKINQQAKRTFDAGMATKLRKITDQYKLAQKTGDYSKVEKILESHEGAIDKFYENNPKAKGKVNLTQFQWDAKNKKFLNPKQVFESQYKGSYKTIPSKIRAGMEKFYGKTGISIDPGTARTLEKSASDVKALTQGKAWNKAIKSSKAKMLAKTLELAGIKVCSSQLAKAGGGRIGFAEQVCGMKFAEQSEDAFMKKAGQNKLAAGMFKSGEIRPFLMKAKNWAKSNMGPTGWIGGELLIVGLGTAWDMSQGKGWKEAMDNWTGLGGHFGKAEERLREIGMEQGYSEAEINDAMKIGQLMDLSTEAEGKQWELEQVQEQQDIGGTARVKYNPKFPGAYKPTQGQYQDPKAIRDLKTGVPKMWEEGTELYESLKDFGSSTDLYNEMQQIKAKEEYDRKMKLREAIRPGWQQFQVSGTPEFESWVPEYAGGGMVGIRRPSALPPTGGPMSQGPKGLAYLKKYGNYS
jgi:hypothetical protein